jgi:hypothetical protein
VLSEVHSLRTLDVSYSPVPRWARVGMYSSGTDGILARRALLQIVEELTLILTCGTCGVPLSQSDISREADRTLCLSSEPA